VLDRCLRYAGAIVVALSATAAAMARLGREPHPLVVGLQAAPRVGVASGLFASLTGVISRKASLALAGAALSLVWMRVGHHVVSSKPSRSRRTDEPGLRVLSANLLKWNRSFSRAADSIGAHDADVIVTIETTAMWMERLGQHWDAQPLAHASGGSIDDTEVVIWSVLPAVATGSLSLGHADFPWARFETAAGLVTVVGVHIKSPVRRSGLRLWKDQLAALTTWTRSQHEPFVLAGDFNAGLGNPSMRSLCATVTDAARRIGVPAAATFPATTYPVGSRPLPFRLMDLDHVLVSGSIDVAAFGTGTVHGSDHDLVWADVTVKPPSSARPSSSITP
jgi:endonuclease/exonuclease/phosphatase (EEP) superfamily protein YafD